MARTKTREITIIESSTGFSFLDRFTSKKDDYDFEGIGILRKLLSNEKARILNTIKTRNPKSVYELAKILGRSFKTVSDDIRLLERFGFIDLIQEKTGKRERLKPVIVVDHIIINFKI